jgi:predicted  nucleic acid-binding Zn-ribbon protein
MIDHNPGWTSGKDVLRALARRTSAPLLNRLWPRVEEIAARHAGAVAGPLRAEIAELRGELRAEVATLHEVLDGLPARVDWAENELRRLAPHLAAVDQRVAGLERPQVTGEASDEARSLVEEIRTEHARVRARLSAVAAYEQRITKVEQAVTALSGNTN